MSMNTAFDILVIALSCLLGIFLLLLIYAISRVIKLVNSVRQLVAKGEQVIKSAESAAALLKRSAGPLGAIRVVAGIINSINKRKRG